MMIIMKLINHVLISLIKNSVEIKAENLTICFYLLFFNFHFL